MELAAAAKRMAGVEEEVRDGRYPDTEARQAQPLCGSLLHQREGGPVNRFSSKPTFGSTKFRFEVWLRRLLRKSSPTPNP